MEAKSILRYVRVAPRKAKAVVDLIRGRDVVSAITTLKYTRRSAARVVEKVLKSAIANAVDREIGDPDELKVVRGYVNSGPTMKRFRARSMGRAHPVKKRTSHITLVVAPQNISRDKEQPRTPGTEAQVKAKAKGKSKD